MIERNLPILIWCLAADEGSLKHLAPITRLDIMDGATLNPHPDGLFSVEIFGPFGNEIRDKRFGRIDLKVTIINPKIWKDVLSLKDQYKKIVDGSIYVKFDKRAGDFITVSEDDPEGQNGYGYFVRHLPLIKFKRNNSLSRNEVIDEVEKWLPHCMVRSIPVLPAGLRDIEIGGDGRVTKNELNDLYYRILSAATAIYQTDNMDDAVYDSVRRNMQNAVNELAASIEGLVGGRRGFMRDKFISRRVMDGTRNVITAMDASGASLNSPNVPGFDSTVLGLYQASRSLAPKMANWLMQGPLSRLRTAGDDQVELINKKTLQREWLSVDPDVIDSYVSELGLMELIHRQEDVDARHRPIVIADHYLALVYRDKTSFKIFDSIEDLPEDRAAKVKDGSARVDPITLEELIYYALYDKVNSHFNVSTRYPGTDDNSTYPTRIYVKTTTTAEPLRELGDNWEIDETRNDKMAPEWPMKGLTTYHDSHSPHSGRLGHSQADFDGDTKSSTSLMTSTALNELENYMKSRNAWVTPDGQMRVTFVYDTSVLIFKNLTGRFNHVKKLDDKQMSQLKRHLQA